MIICLAETKQKARKEYFCNACENILYGDSFENLIESGSLTEVEKQALLKAKENGYKIQKGEVYLRWACINDGTISTCRAIPAIADICTRLELWAED